jgi:sugar phosphate permease
VVLGIGEGLHWPMQMKFVKNWFPPTERGKANSVWLSGLMFAPAVAMPLFTWLITTVGWRRSFFVMAALSLISIALLYFMTTDRPDQNRRVNKAELDHVMAGLTPEAEREAAMGATTALRSYKQFVRDYRYWLLAVFYVCSSAVYWGTIAWLPSYFRTALGFDWTSMGAWSSLPYTLGFISLIVFGYLTDRYDKKVFFAAISLLVPAVFIFLSAHAANVYAAAIYVSIGISGVAIGLPAHWAIQQQLVPGKAVAAGAGLLNGCAMVSAAIAPLVIGYFIKITGSYTSGLMYLVAVSILGCAAIIWLGFAMSRTPGKRHP